MSAAETDTRPDPRRTVLAWWQAMEAGDVSALTELALEDYLSAGGPQLRTLGRESLLDGASEFFASASIDHWQIDDLVLHDLGGVAICSYEWTERGSHGGSAFALAGVATDVLVLHGTKWRYQAHHVSQTSEDRSC